MNKLTLREIKEVSIICENQLGRLTGIRDFNSNTLFSLEDNFKIHERHLKKRKIEENYEYGNTSV